MTVTLRCIGNTGIDLAEDFLARSGNTAASRFSITIGEEYVARAIAVWTYGVGALIVDDTGRPNWKPLGLFAVVDGRLPTHWEFVVVAGRDPVVALFGYPALIHDPKHHDDLIERKLSALSTFVVESGASQDSRLRLPWQQP